MHSNAAILLRDSTVIPLSQRDCFDYLEQACIQVDDGRVVARCRQDGMVRTFNVPALNLASLILGNGVSITGEAMQLLGAAGCVVTFCGSAGAPTFGSTEACEFVAPTSEYRPTEYMQTWMARWPDAQWRLQAARELLRQRVQLATEKWSHPGFDDFVAARLKCRRPSIEKYAQELADVSDVTALRGKEGGHVKAMYAFLAQYHGLTDFKREHTRTGINARLTTGNYIAYGMAAAVLSALGISFAFPVNHGAHRRGGLVFDLADVIKDAYVLPLAFELRNADEGEFRRTLKEQMYGKSGDAMRTLFDVVKQLCN